VSSRPSGRTSSFDVANIDAAFAMLDTAGSSPVIFGRKPRSANQITEIQADLARENSFDSADGSVRCEGNIAFGRRCTVYRRLMNSSIVFAALIGDRELRTEWIQQSRPIWTFALLFLLGGAGSSAFITLWVQQRRRDRLKLTAALEEVRQAYAAKSNFMAHMNHELRTPLNAIVGFSELLRGAFFGPLNERYRSYAEDIHFSATHLHKLVTEVLNLERMERSTLSIEAHEADLNVVAADAVRMLSVLALSKGVKVEFFPWPQAAIVLLDPHRTAQIAINLVSNAVKYSEPNDVVKTSVTRTGDGHFALVVADQGIGMTAAEIAHTAQPFGQPADRRSGRHDSVGLGLPIVRGLLAVTGGDLVIVSEKHKGTTASAIFGPRKDAA
jgi:signal transduction histidine kinase